MAKRRNSKPNSQSAAPAPMIDAPSPRLRAARGLWNKGAHNDAIALFLEAIRQEPNNVQTYIVAARAYAEKYQFDRMDATLDKLVRRAPRHPGVHHYIGETFGSLKLPERAIASYETAARLPGAGPPTWMELAGLYERAHRLEEAQELIEKTVRTQFDHPLVALVRGRVQRRLKQYDLAEATFHAAIQRTGDDSIVGCQAWGEIASMRDQAGDYEGAMEAIERCKRVQRAHQEPYWTISEGVQSRLADMYGSLTRQDFQMWKSAASDLPPSRTALLTGFPRSGTTLLEQVLDAHPDLVSSEERDFVGTELYCAIAQRRKATPIVDLLNEVPKELIVSQRNRYFEAMEYLLGAPIAGRMHLDKNPAYNLVIPLMLRIFPDARLIVALRDPRDVVLSCYLRYLPLNSVSVRFLDPKRAAERYAFDMSAWLKFREMIETPWCEVRYEDTVADVATQARRALETLGLPWSDNVLNYRERLVGSTKQVTSPTYEAVARPIYTNAIGRWKHYERLLEPAFESLSPFISEFGYD